MLPRKSTLPLVVSSVRRPADHFLLNSSSSRVLRSAWRLAAREASSTQVRSIASNAKPILEQLDLVPARPEEPISGVYDGKWKQGKGEILRPIDPATGKPIGLQVSCADHGQTLEAIGNAREAFKSWRNVPGPKRGEILKDFNRELVRLKEPLAGLITLEMGKIKSESLGEVEEVVQICDFGTGLSRIFGGKIIASERQGHIIKEIPNPLGLVGVVTAFNFPC
jgi:aldehyde dehydrogenase family 7 protein A1